VFSPAVRIFGLSQCLSMYYSRFNGLFYKEFLYALCSFFIIVHIRTGNFIKFRCKVICGRVFFPFSHTGHILRCIFSTYPLISKFSLPRWCLIRGRWLLSGPVLCFIGVIRGMVHGSGWWVVTYGVIVCCMWVV
jgi:hypothetical protein